MDGDIPTVLTEVNLHVGHDAMAAVNRRCVVQHVSKYHAISGQEVGLQLGVGHDVKDSENSI